MSVSINGMLAPDPLHQPAVVFEALAEIGAGPSFPHSGLAVVHDGHGPDHINRDDIDSMNSDQTDFEVATENAPECVLIPDVPSDPPQHDRIRALAPLFHALSTARNATSVALVVLRGGDAAPRGHDYAWHDACAEAARAVGIAQAGVYVFARSVLARVRTGHAVTV